MPLPAVAAAAGRVAAKGGQMAAKGAAKGAKAAGRGAKAAGKKTAQAGRKAGQKLGKKAQKKAQSSAMDKMQGGDEENRKNERRNQKNLGALQASMPKAPGAGGGQKGGAIKAPGIASKAKLATRFLPGKAGDYLWDAAIIIMGASFIYTKAALWIMIEEGGLTKKNIKRSIIIIMIWLALFLLLVMIIGTIAWCYENPFECGWEIIKGKIVN